MWDQTISLAPDAQALLDQQMAQSRQVGDVAGGLLPRIASTYSQPLDLSGLPQSYGANDLLGARKESQDAIYNRYTDYLDPQYAERDRNLATTLANKGVVEGSEAYNNAQSQQGRERAFDYGQAREAAVVGGGAEQDRLYGQSTDARSRALAEMLMQRDRPLQEFNQLRGSSPVDLPQFQNAPDVTLQGTDVMSPIYRGYQSQVDVANANAQRKTDAYNAWLSAISNAIPF